MITRKLELCFGLTLLGAALLPTLALELAARHREVRNAERIFDWKALARAAGRQGEDGMLLFKPGRQYKNLRFNSLGFRGPELATSRPANSLRIAFAGDSKMFSAELAERQTIPAQTVAQLSAKLPQCRFDYVLMAGPAYDLPFLAKLFRARSADVRPDMAVLLAGPARSLITPRNSIKTVQSEPELPWLKGPGAFGPLFEKSAALRLIKRELALLSPMTPPAADANVSIDVLRGRLRDMLHDVDVALRPLPVVAIGYRARSARVGGSNAPALAARDLRKRFPGLTTDMARQVSALVIDEMRAYAGQVGWRYIDPIANVVGNPNNYLDEFHFSARGARIIALSISASVASSIGSDCKPRATVRLTAANLPQSNGVVVDSATTPGLRGLTKVDVPVHVADRRQTALAVTAPKTDL